MSGGIKKRDRQHIATRDPPENSGDGDNRGATAGDPRTEGSSSSKRMKLISSGRENRTLQYPSLDGFHSDSTSSEHTLWFDFDHTTR